MLIKGRKCEGRKLENLLTNQLVFNMEVLTWKKKGIHVLSYNKNTNKDKSKKKNMKT